MKNIDYFPTNGYWDCKLTIKMENGRAINNNFIMLLALFKKIQEYSIRVQADSDLDFLVSLLEYLSHRRQSPSKTKLSTGVVKVLT
jgi:hypothetical protein